MKRVLTLVLSVALVASIAAVATSGEKSAKAWFDLESCGMCSNLSAQDGLLEHVTWEQHNLANGIVSVTTVADGYLEKYRAANKKMEQVGMKMMQGEKIDLCGMCTSLSGIMMGGKVMPDYVMTQHGSVMILTSQDAETVKSLQKWAATTNSEMEKMDEHAGHNHG